MNFLRAGVLAVVGTTKTDLRASLEDENTEIETLFDPTLGITDGMFEAIELTMAEPHDRERHATHRGWRGGAHNAKLPGGVWG